MISYSKKCLLHKAHEWVQGDVHIPILSSQWSFSTLLKQQCMWDVARAALWLQVPPKPCVTMLLYLVGIIKPPLFSSTHLGVSRVSRKAGRKCMVSGTLLKVLENNRKMVTCSNRHSRSSMSFFNLTSEEIRKTYR